MKIDIKTALDLLDNVSDAGKLLAKVGKELVELFRKDDED